MFGKSLLVAVAFAAYANAAQLQVQPSANTGAFAEIKAAANMLPSVMNGTVVGAPIGSQIAGSTITNGVLGAFPAASLISNSLKAGKVNPAALGDMSEYLAVIEKNQLSMSGAVAAFQSAAKAKGGFSLKAFEAAAKRMSAGPGYVVPTAALERSSADFIAVVEAAAVTEKEQAAIASLSPAQRELVGELAKIAATESVASAVQDEVSPYLAYRAAIQVILAAVVGGVTNLEHTLQTKATVFLTDVLTAFQNEQGRADVIAYGNGYVRAIEAITNHVDAARKSASNPSEVSIATVQIAEPGTKKLQQCVLTGQAI